MLSRDALVELTEETHGIQIDMIYARADNFTGKVIYPHAKCYLHPDAEVLFKHAISAAKNFGFRIKVFDAFRSQQAQQALWDCVPDPRYVADPKIGSNHTRGVALDITLQSLDGQDLDMGTAVDTMTKASHHFYPDLAAPVLINRMYLMTVMQEAGFIHHPNEWWHYQLPNASRFALLELPV
ncbi:D-alanyl-D-alanine dipeptidase [Polaromonas vacuolata]|uniref:D-alanyl-D-alanine dipeptidase n=1 Tax=Polaromonas vacuolata TaxID=37448 RepID=A0A6H2H5Q3_9BURK|nr:D-alanyl-D-alanine dipeptidase [Polaromonas vacuolata]QJC55097.1 D-alanyl-D-alanine dipeptidase [Polaromonas vacuolata]